MEELLRKERHDAELRLQADECPTCFEPFTSAFSLRANDRLLRTLPCGGRHAVCDSCLRKQQLAAAICGTTELTCPTCRETFPIQALEHHDGLMVVIDGCNVAMWGTGDRNWLNLAVAVRHFVCQSIRPVVVLKKKDYEELTPDLSVEGPDGTSHPLRDYVTPAPRGVELTLGEEDDVMAVKLAQHYRCPFVSNDNFRSWTAAVKATSTMAVWLQTAEIVGLHLRFTFSPDHAFLPEPPYPFAAAKRYAQAEAPRPPSTELGIHRRASSSATVVVEVCSLAGAGDAEGRPERVSLALDPNSTLTQLHEAAAAQLGVPAPEQSIFLYGQVRLPTSAPRSGALTHACSGARARAFNATPVPTPVPTPAPRQSPRQRHDMVCVAFVRLTL